MAGLAEEERLHDNAVESEPAMSAKPSPSPPLLPPLSSKVDYFTADKPQIMQSLLVGYLWIICGLLQIICRLYVDCLSLLARIV